MQDKNLGEIRKKYTGPGACLRAACSETMTPYSVQPVHVLTATPNTVSWSGDRGGFATVSFRARNPFSAACARPDKKSFGVELVANQKHAAGETSIREWWRSGDLQQLA